MEYIKATFITKVVDCEYIIFLFLAVGGALLIVLQRRTAVSVVVVPPSSSSSEQQMCGCWVVVAGSRLPDVVQDVIAGLTSNKNGDFGQLSFQTQLNGVL